MNIITPYSTAMRYAPNTAPSWVSAEDHERIRAYAFYENIYDNVPETFQIAQRGTDADPVYIPSAKIIIEATNRFLAKDFTYMVDPDVGSPEAQAAANLAFRRLFKREDMYAKFASQRRYGLIRGDAVWHVLADPRKPAGRRLSIQEVDPASYFPIYDEEDPDRLLGVHLVTPFLERDGSTTLLRQTYRKQPENRISTEYTKWHLGAWDDRILGGRLELIKTIISERLLPADITSIPVYLIKNGRVPSSPFGFSELRGIERLMAAVNQTVSDQEIALALEGLGVYATTSGAPVDDKGNETTWKIGPGRVIELEPDSSFQRVTGITSIAPSLEHIRFIMGSMQQAIGVPDIAVGNVDVTVAESGIALAMHLSPLLAKNEEKEASMLGVYDQMLYDIAHMWFPAYEGLLFPDVEVVSVVSDPMPKNRRLELDDIIKLVTAGIMSVATAQSRLTALGFEFDPNEMAMIKKELEDKANADLYGSRVDAEMA